MATQFKRTNDTNSADYGRRSALTAVREAIQSPAHADAPRLHPSPDSLAAAAGAVADTAPTRTAVVLPPIPAGVSHDLKLMIDRYIAAFFAEGADDDATSLNAELWDQAALDIKDRRVATDADVAAKLIVGIHYLHPGMVDGRLAADLTAFESTPAGELMLGLLDDVMRRLDSHATPARPARRGPTEDTAWQSAHAAVVAADLACHAMRAAGRSWDVIDPATWQTLRDAQQALLTVPAPTIADLSVKLQIFDREEMYDYAQAGEYVAAIAEDARRLAAADAVAVPSSAGAIKPDALAAAWADFTAAGAAIRAAGFDAPYEIDAPARQFGDQADVLICDTPAATIGDAAIKLSRALMIIDPDKWVCDAIIDGNYDTIRARAHELDYEARLVAEALVRIVDHASIGSTASAQVSSSNGGIRSLLDERNRLLRAIDERADDDMAEAADDRDVTAVNDLDGRILAASVNTTDDLIAKLLLLVQVGAEGAEPSEEICVSSIRDAKRIAGMGYYASVHDERPDHAAGEADVPLSPIDEADHVRVSWAGACAGYETARREEMAYEVASYLPAFNCEVAGGATIPAEINNEIERLTNARYATEDVLMDVPAPDAAAFAYKFMVAFDDDRAGTGWTEMLIEEAARFAVDFNQAVRSCFNRAVRS